MRLPLDRSHKKHSRCMCVCVCVYSMCAYFISWARSSSFFFCCCSCRCCFGLAISHNLCMALASVSSRYFFSSTKRNQNSSSWYCVLFLYQTSFPILAVAECFLAIYRNSKSETQKIPWNNAITTLRACFHNHGWKDEINHIEPYHFGQQVDTTIWPNISYAKHPPRFNHKIHFYL